MVRSRCPVSFGDVEGMFRPSILLLLPGDSNARSSRRGKEHTRLKIFEDGTEEP